MSVHVNVVDVQNFVSVLFSFLSIHPLSWMNNFSIKLNSLLQFILLVLYSWTEHVTLPLEWSQNEISLKAE